MKTGIFAKRVQDIAVSAIKQMPLHARAVPDAVSLGQGIPSLKTPASIRKAVARWLESSNDIGKYSLQPGLPQLKAEIASIVSERAGRPVDIEREIFVSAGAMEALFAALVTIVETGDEVILFDPGYASHIEQVLFAGGTPVFVPLREETGWRPCFETLEKSITGKTKAIVVCNPNNPTGTLLSIDDLTIIAKLAERHGIYVVADETYNFLVYDGASCPSLTRFPAIKDQVIACYSFSKQFSMTGWRVGYMYGPAAVVDQALKVHDAAMICAPTISQYAALAALTEKPDPEDEDIFEILTRRRDLTCSRLDDLSGLFSYVRPSGAYYVLPRYLKTEMTSTEFAMKLLYEAKVIVIPGRAFGPAGERHVRLSYGGTEEDINKAFDRIQSWNKAL